MNTEHDLHFWKGLMLPFKSMLRCQCNVDPSRPQLLKDHFFIKYFLSKNVIFDKYLTYLTKLPGIWQIWWYLITKRCISSANNSLFVIKYHQICQIPGSFVKYVKYLSNISVFDRNYLMKTWSFTHICASEVHQISIDFIVCPPLHYAGRWLHFNFRSLV